MKKTSIKKRVTTPKRRAHAQEELCKESIREDSGILCPDCREPMIQVLTHAFKWECRCSPGIHYCE
jgi:hypothetical protein